MTVAGVLKLIHRAFPWGKKFLPFPLFQYVMRGFFSDESCFVYLAHRRWMRDVLIPYLSRHSTSMVVFVGCANYTWYYERSFQDSRASYITIDPVPSARVWGSSCHIQDCVKHVDRHLPEQSVDAVVLVGILGLTIREDDHLRDALLGIHRVLKPGGILVLSWQADAGGDPSAHPVLRDLFIPSHQQGIEPRNTFNTNCVIDLYQSVRRATMT